MNRILKILCGAACAFAFCFLAIGYAAVQDTLSVTGSITIEKQEEEIVITCADTNAYVLDGTTGELTIQETYIGDDNKTYRVIGIKENGFSSDSNEVGYDASEVTSVIIPKSVKTIGDNAFTGCSNLKSFTVDSENEYFIARDQVLFNKAGTNLLRYPACNKYPSPMLYHIPSATSEINAYAFCDLPASTVVVTQDSAGNPWGATSVCLILEANETNLYNAMQSASWDSASGYTIACDSSIKNTNLVFINGNGTKKWEAVEENPQFTIPSSICDTSGPSVISVSTVFGDINSTQLSRDLVDENATIGGGDWSWIKLVGNRDDSTLTIEDGNFNDCVFFSDHTYKIIINGGIFSDGISVYGEGSNQMYIYIYDGTFDATSITAFASSSSNAHFVIYGGTFYFEPTDYAITNFKIKIDDDSYVINNGNGTWTVVSAPNAALVNEEETTICSCETKCADLNDACEVCKTDITNCKGTEAPIGEELTCSCETKCTELTEACEVCKTDISFCKGTEAPAAICSCTTQCTAENTRGDCPVCGAAPENCSPVVCTCESACPGGEANAGCPVCSTNAANCSPREPEPAAQCGCTVKCAEGAVNENCTVCTADMTGCIITESQPAETSLTGDPPGCTCETKCTELNSDCPICGTDIAGCIGKTPEPPAATSPETQPSDPTQPKETAPEDATE